MYIKKLKNWRNEDWELFFKQYPNLEPHQKREVKQILCMKNKDIIEEHFWVLEFYGIINWIGPGWLSRFFRKIITFLFRWVKYEWHDIGYAIWWNEQDRKNTDKGLWKYSFEWVEKSFWKIWEMKLWNLELIIFSVLYVFFVPLRLVIAGFCYFMVRIFWRYGAFRYLEK